MAHAGHLGTTRPLWLRKEEELANLPSIKEGFFPISFGIFISNMKNYRY